jgi:hypothetical protein
MLFCVHIKSFSQSNKSSQYYYYLQKNDENRGVINVRGIVLDFDSLKPIDYLPPVVTLINWDNRSTEKYEYINAGTFDTSTGSFSFEVGKGKYKFLCSQLGYFEIYTDWIDLDVDDLYIVFILKRYDREGFH